MVEEIKQSNVKQGEEIKNTNELLINIVLFRIGNYISLVDCSQLKLF